MERLLAADATGLGCTEALAGNRVAAAVGEHIGG